MKDFVCPADMTYTRRIKDAGFVLLGPQQRARVRLVPMRWSPIPLRPYQQPLGAWSAPPAAPAAVPPRRWPPAWCPSSMRATARGPRVYPPPIAGWSGSSPRAGRVTLDPFPDYWYGGASFLTVTHTVRETAAYLDAVGGRVLGDVYYTEMPGVPPTWTRWGKRPRHSPHRRHHDRARRAADPRGGGAGGAGRGRALREPRPPGGGAAAGPRLGALLDHLHADDRDPDRRPASRTSAALVGRPVAEEDLAPLIWGLIQKGGAVGGPQHYRDVNDLRLR